MTAADTIFALSSGVGRAAIAVIRLSGPATAALLQTLAGALPEPRMVTLRTLRARETAEVLDRALITWMPGPRSFTGEDCAELHLHGSRAIVAGIMDVLAGWPGVRPAEQGEFTRRAFANGKMDLVEVEGLADLLDAKTARQRRQAFRHMSGEVSRVFETWREQLLLIRADIEAAVDFIDEPGVAEAASATIDRRIGELRQEMQREADRSEFSEILRDGARIVLAGRPNTGKSSLLNALARREAAIVSDIPGTTRDVIEVTLDIDGMPVVITDTAGLRPEVMDPVECEGIRRSYRHASEADLVLWVWSPDVSGSATPDEMVSPDLVVLNKSDLLTRRPDLPRNDKDISISCRESSGLQELIAAISRLLKDRFGEIESALLVSERQKSAVGRSIRLLNDACLIEPGSLELKAELIRQATEEVARLTGRVDVEEWLGAIFSRFCIGK